MSWAWRWSFINVSKFPCEDRAQWPMTTIIVIIRVIVHPCHLSYVRSPKICQTNDRRSIVKAPLNPIADFHANFESIPLYSCKYITVRNFYIQGHRDRDTGYKQGQIWTLNNYSSFMTIITLYLCFSACLILKKCVCLEMWMRERCCQDEKPKESQFPNIQYTKITNYQN